MLEEQTPREEPRVPLATAAIAVIVLAAIGISLWAVLKPLENKPAPAIQVNLPAAMTTQEKAYASSVRFENISLSRAENFIHQAVIIVHADAVNDGPRTLDRLFVTVEFSDGMNQVVLRESRGILGNSQGPLGPGQRRSLELSFDGVPPSWNMQQPALYASYIQFSPVK